MQINNEELPVIVKLPAALIEEVVKRLQKRPFEEVADVLPPMVRALKGAEEQSLKEYLGEVKQDAVLKHIENEQAMAAARARATAVPEQESPDESEAIDQAELEGGSTE